ncbi:MAG: radical SAM protein, partial [Clostridia bacterium]|nr:radical SAM protein [Clostridia bacterium]
DSFGKHIDPKIASCAVRKIAAEYDIKTVMTFGGEPLLYPDEVACIMKVASELGIPKRQVITNGYFTKDEKKIEQIAQKLYECGVNDLLLSVDAFHQETIPLDIVKIFAKCAKEYNIPIRLQPAWLVARDDDNPYNNETKRILAEFKQMDLPLSEGNVIFPEGNALKYLSEYFKESMPLNPYVEDPRDVRCLSVSPNGDVLGGNIYQNDILEIIKDYTP